MTESRPASTIHCPGALSVLTEDGPFANDAVTYGYDELGRLSSQTVGDTYPEAWHYDPIGRSDTHLTALGTFSYSYLGQTASPISRALPGTSISTTWSYDTNANDRRLLGISNSNGARSFALGYSRFGSQTGVSPYQVTSVNETGGGLPAQLLCNQYDDAGRLTTVTTANGTCSLTRYGLYTYAPDAAGNLTTFTSATSTTNPTYSANGLNQIATNGAQSFAYDLAGNETSDGTRTFKWDAENRVVEIDSGSTVLATFRYDGLGRRLEVAHPGLPPDRFSWCGSKLCARRSGDTTVVRHFAEGEFHPRAQTIIPITDDSGNTSFVVYGGRLVAMTDHLGNVANLVDASNGSLFSSADYTPYGQIKSGGNPSADVPYAGLYRDGAVGLYYSNTRVFDPSIGRWTSRDLIGERGGINLYAYVGGDPINRLDPTGTFDLGPAAAAAATAAAEGAAAAGAWVLSICGAVLFLPGDAGSSPGAPGSPPPPKPDNDNSQCDYVSDYIRMFPGGAWRMCQYQCANGTKKTIVLPDYRAQCPRTA